ncbi:MAG: YhfC family intramembrane metalloprotease [Alicyclobacillus sp.]|nr:YhfC family intramembrane metalloprotease [Alicyclobacillus sp.]
MNMPIQSAPPDADMFRKAVRNFYVAAPLYILIPVAFWWCFQTAGVPWVGKAVWLGAAGWMIALILRWPVMLAMRKQPQARFERVIVGLSGPLEEVVRVVMLLETARSLGWGASFGQGWAAVEVMYTLVAGFAQASILTRTDEKAVQAREILLQRLGKQVMMNPLHGVLERVTASAFHIGSSLMVARSPWFALMMIPLHSGWNLAAVQLLRFGIAWEQMLNLVLGVAVMGMGVMAWWLR